VKDEELGLYIYGDGKSDDVNRALWYLAGASPAPEFRMRQGSSPDAGDRELGADGIKI
jgi:hypothetical protein